MGVVRAATLHELLAAQSAGIQVLAEVSGQESSIIEESDSLYDAFNLLVSTGADAVAVYHQGRAVGKISYKDIAEAYHRRIHSKN